MFGLIFSCSWGSMYMLFNSILLFFFLQKRRMKLVVLLDFVSVFFLLTLLLVTAQLAFGSQIQDDMLFNSILLFFFLQKRRMKLVVLLDFVSVFFLLTLLLVTAQLAFGSQIQDVYTLNFSHPTFLKYTLQLFPVLTLSANFPTMAITLRENLTILFLNNHRNKNAGGSSKNVGGNGDSGDKFTGGSSDSVNAGGQRAGGQRSGLWVFRRIVIPLLTLLPPLVVSFFTFNVEMLVSVTGKVLEHILIRKYIRSSKNLRIHPKFRFGGIFRNFVFRSGEKLC